MNRTFVSYRRKGGETMTVQEYIKAYCPNPSVLTKNEIEQIEYYKEFKDIFMIEFNKKGHLIFRQRYPDFPLYFSAIILFTSIIVFGFAIS